MKKILKSLLTSQFVVAALFAGALGLTSVVGTTDAVNAEYTLDTGKDSAKGEGQPDDLFEDGGVFQIIANVLLFLIGAISVIMLIFGGIRYTTSGGDQGAVTSAKNTIMYAVVGIVVAILAFAVVNFVIGSLREQ